MSRETITVEWLETAYQRRGPALVRLFCGMLRSRNGNYDYRSVAEDLTQETFIRVWFFRKQYCARQNASINTWVGAITLNTFRDFLRKERPDREIDLDSVAAAVAEETPESIEQNARAYANLLATVESILEERDFPPHYRMAFMLRVLEGFPVKKIAEITGQSENTLRCALWRTRKTLQKGLAARA